jgi:SAM-dependent methyltransferase
LLPEKFRALFRGGNPDSSPNSLRNGRGIPDREEVMARGSRGLEQFFFSIRDQTALTLLDLSGANQSNITFITNLGHRLYSEDFVRSIRETFGSEDPNEQGNSGQIDSFLQQNLDYPEEHFEAVLVWDVLEYLGPALLAATVERLYRVVRPGGYLLAFFHSDERLSQVPYYSFRIRDFNELQVVQRGARQPAQLFNNRSLERLFHRFESVKFFLTREHLREIIVRR